MAFPHMCNQRRPPVPQEMIPFAVVGSDHEYQVNGKRILGRKTKWGTIEGTRRRCQGCRQMGNSLLCWPRACGPRLSRGRVEPPPLHCPTQREGSPCPHSTLGK